MSPVDRTGYTSPFIAGADGPIHGAQMGGPGDDAFAATDSCDYETDSPDTLQSLAASNKDHTQLFVSPSDLTSFQVSTSPNEGSFHEYSSDSAESSRKGDRTSPPPHDATMDGMFDQPLDGHDSDPFDCMMVGDHPSFMNGMEHSPRNDGLTFDFNDTGVSNQHIDFSHEFGDSTVTPADTLFHNGGSPAADDHFSKHHRQHSVLHPPRHGTPSLRSSMNVSKPCANSQYLAMLS